MIGSLEEAHARRAPQEEVRVTGRAISEHTGLGMKDSKKEAGKAGNGLPEEQLVNQGKHVVRIGIAMGKSHQACFHHSSHPSGVDAVTGDIAHKDRDRPVLQLERVVEVSSYDRFLAENDPARKNEAGKDLIRAIFGKDAFAGDSIR